MRRWGKKRWPLSCCHSFCKLWLKKKTSAAIWTLKIALLFNYTRSKVFSRSVKMIKETNHISVSHVKRRQLLHQGKMWYICHQWCWGRNGCWRSGQSHLDKARPSKVRTETHRQCGWLMVPGCFQNWVVWTLTYRLDQHVDSQVKFFTCDEKWEITFWYSVFVHYSVQEHRFIPLIR